MSKLMNKKANLTVSLCNNEMKDTFFGVSFFAFFNLFYYFYFIKLFGRKVKTAVI